MTSFCSTNLPQSRALPIESHLAYLISRSVWFIPSSRTCLTKEESPQLTKEYNQSAPWAQPPTTARTWSIGGSLPHPNNKSNHKISIKWNLKSQESTGMLLSTNLPIDKGLAPFGVWRRIYQNIIRRDLASKAITAGKHRFTELGVELISHTKSLNIRNLNNMSTSLHTKSLLLQEAMDLTLEDLNPKLGEGADMLLHLNPKIHIRLIELTKNRSMQVVEVPSSQTTTERKPTHHSCPSQNLNLRSCHLYLCNSERSLDQDPQGKIQLRCQAWTNFRISWTKLLRNWAQLRKNSTLCNLVGYLNQWVVACHLTIRGDHTSARVKTKTQLKGNSTKNWVVWVMTFKNNMTNWAQLVEKVQKEVGKESQPDLKKIQTLSEMSKTTAGTVEGLEDPECLTVATISSDAF